MCLCGGGGGLVSVDAAHQLRPRSLASVFLYMGPLTNGGGLRSELSHPPPPMGPTALCGERCNPRGPISSEVTKALRAHRELPSFKWSAGREVLSMPQDLPSTGTPPSGLALCAAPPVSIWVSQGAPQTTPLGFGRGLEEAAGHPTRRLPQQP